MDDVVPYELGGPPIPCDDARQKVRRIAIAIVSGETGPHVGANSIYWTAWAAGAWDDDSPCEELSVPGAEFVQLAYELEKTRDLPDVKAAWQALVRECAAAYLAGKPWPDWELTGDSPYPVRHESQP